MFTGWKRKHSIDLRSFSILRHSRAKLLQRYAQLIAYSNFLVSSFSGQQIRLAIIRFRICFSLNSHDVIVQSSLLLPKQSNSTQSFAQFGICYSIFSSFGLLPIEILRLHQKTSRSSKNHLNTNQLPFTEKIRNVEKTRIWDGNKNMLVYWPVMWYLFLRIVLKLESKHIFYVSLCWSFA